MNECVCVGECVCTGVCVCVCVGGGYTGAEHRGHVKRQLREKWS